MSLWSVYWRFRIIPALTRSMWRVAARRPPDFIIGGKETPYLLRWYLTPWRKWSSEEHKGTMRYRVARLLPNVYLHQFLRSDDDRALHDHPWPNISLLLYGEYVEHTIRAGGINERRLRTAGALKFRRASSAHRVELVNGHYCWTLFITGPVVRDWGFHCPDAGWVFWKDFVDARDAGSIGRGCAQ